LPHLVAAIQLTQPVVFILHGCGFIKIKA
jgi:hypothetical protein